MATFTLFLDKRGQNGNRPSPLKFVIRAHCKSSMISVGISLLPSQWDAQNLKVISHPRKSPLNNIITQMRLDYETAFIKVTTANMALSADEIKQKILAVLNPSNDNNTRTLFKQHYYSFMSAKQGRTVEIYQATEKRLKDFCCDAYENLTFEDITPQWLRDFDLFLSQTSPSPNARNIHLRNIRAVFNDALNNELTSAYPFRKFKIKGVATVKRSLTIEDLRILFAYNPNDYTTKYLDIFKLIFMLIGINIVDLCKLKSIEQGRAVFYRSKTKRLYSIKVEPEAETIIKQYAGVDFLLDIMDRYADYRTYAKRLNQGIKPICSALGLPPISTYWARHSWATIASSLDIPKETIAAALGHGGNTVTDIYIDFDQSKVDEANRKVLDWVLYGKR